MRERPRDGKRLLDRHRAKFLRHIVERLAPLVGAPRGFRRGANALDAFEEGLAFLPAQRVSEQRPQQPHVVAQRLMRVVPCWRVGVAGRLWRYNSGTLDRLLHCLAFRKCHRDTITPPLSPPKAI